MRKILMIAVSIATLAGPGRAVAYQVVFDHQGSTDPTSEGWMGAGGGPVNDDAGSGFDAWIVDDNETAGSAPAFYQEVDDSAIGVGNALGWRLSARLRIVDVPDNPGGSPALLYRDGSRTWQISFGTTSAGDPRLALITGVTSSGGITALTEFTLTGGGSGYHLYELVYDPTLGSSDLFIDGNEVVSNYVGAPFGGGFPIPKSVFWGSGSTTDVGQGNYNLARFELGITNVPTSHEWIRALLAAMIMALGLVMLHRRRRDGGWIHGKA